MNFKILIISIIVFIIFVILGIIIIFKYFRNNININNVVSEENNIESKININNVVSEENQKKNINNTSTSNIIKEESKIESKINSDANIEILTSGNAQIIPNNVNLISEVKTQVHEINSDQLKPINFVIKTDSTPAYTKNTNVRGYCKDFYSTWHQVGGLRICASCKDELGLYKHSCIVQCKGNYKNNNGKLDCE
jgi:hypothetical protein